MQRGLSHLTCEDQCLLWLDMSVQGLSPEHSLLIWDRVLAEHQQAGLADSPDKEAGAVLQVWMEAGAR